MDKEMLSLIIEPLKESIKDSESRISEGLTRIQNQMDNFDKRLLLLEEKDDQFRNRMHELSNKITPPDYIEVLEKRIERNENLINELISDKQKQEAAEKALADARLKESTNKQRAFDNFIKSKWLIGVASIIVIVVGSFFIGFIQDSPFHKAGQSIAQHLKNQN